MHRSRVYCVLAHPHSTSRNELRARRARPATNAAAAGTAGASHRAAVARARRSSALFVAREPPKQRIHCANALVAASFGNFLAEICR
jgi:hypothetical protein